KLPDAADALDDVPDIILSRHIWNWHAISYSTFCRALVKMSSDTGEHPSKRQKPDTTADKASDMPEDIDDWTLSHEKIFGESERLRNDWRRGLVALGNAANLKLDIQPSVAAFRRIFERMSDELLENADWNNIFVAGRIVLGTLLALDALPGKPQPADQWKSSDIDIYIHGLGPNAANEKIAQLLKTFRVNLLPRNLTLVMRSSKTITFYSHYPPRSVQVVLKAQAGQVSTCRAAERRPRHLRDGLGRQRAVDAPAYDARARK
ncbi:hypothetical protein DFH09DRAFT_1422560, partial [Mycena vulgaris]